MGRAYQLFGAFCVFLVFYYVWTACRGLKYRRGLFLVQASALVFVLIGYKQLEMPILTYLFMGAFGIPALIYGVMYDTNIPLILATAYLPYSQLLPGTFGGVQKAFNATNIILVAVFLGVLVGKKESGRNSARRDPVVLLVFLFIFFSFLAFAQAGFTYGSFYLERFVFPLKRWLTPFIVFYLFYKKLSDRKVIKIIFAIVMITVIANIFFGVLEWVNIGFATYSERKFRLRGINLQPNFYGAFIAFYLTFLAGPLLTGCRKAAGRFLLFPLLLGMRIIIPVNSRGAWIALPPALLTVGVFRNKFLIPLVVVAVLIMLANPELVPQTIRERFAAGLAVDATQDIYALEQRKPGDFLGESKSISIRSRYVLFQAGMQMVQERPWFGFGWATFPFLAQDYSPTGRGGTAHNMFLQIATEMGIPALAVLLGVFALLFKAGIFVFRREGDPMLKGMALGLLGSIPAVIVNNLTGSRLDSVDLTVIFWIVSACTIRLKQIIEFERSQPARH